MSSPLLVSAGSRPALVAAAFVLQLFLASASAAEPVLKPASVKAKTASPILGPVTPSVAEPLVEPARLIWTISSRNACWTGGELQPRLGYWYFDHVAGCWTPSTLEAFLASDEPGVPTCFFVHGNRVSRNEAFYVGWRAYQRLAAQASPEQPFRFVIWSWPSSRIHGQLKDARAKAYQSDAHAVYLAWLMDQMDPQVPVSLLGYSYGARLITGSLHILGGGRLIGRALPARLHPDRLPARVVLMAGALDNYSLKPYARNGLALTQVERMLVMTNPADEVLRYYRLLYGLHGRTQALGYTGAAGLGLLGSSQSKVTHWNVARYVGPDHELNRYLYSPSVIAGMASYALYGD